MKKIIALLILIIPLTSFSQGNMQKGINWIPLNEAKKYAYLLGYNYQSSEWYERTYKVFNKKYQPPKVNLKKDKNKQSLIEKIRSKIF